MNCQTSLFCFSALLLLSWHAHADLSNVQRVFSQQVVPASFEVCQGGGCLQPSETQVSTDEIVQIKAMFSPVPTSAEQERATIAKAIGLMERIIGPKIGTAQDKAGTFNSTAPGGQQDCNDEATNTTTYIKLFQHLGLLRFHQTDDLRTRNYFFGGWPHTTASIEELATGDVYAVDSWFYHNGHDAVVVPIAEWKDNYRPSDSPIYQSKD